MSRKPVNISSAVYLADEDGCIWSEAGHRVRPSINHEGYEFITKRMGRRFAHAFVHRMVWEAHFGPIPPGLVVDHINRKMTDNRLVNLRITTKSGNGHNTKRMGVHLVRDKWRAVGRSNGAQHHIGYFTSRRAAVAAKMQWRSARVAEENKQAIIAAGGEVEP